MTSNQANKTPLTNRLRGQYDIGPHLPNGKPEFGWRQFPATPINLEAANRIEELENANDELQKSLNLRKEADRRAIKLWQEKNNRELIWPDHVDLVVWLIEQI